MWWLREFSHMEFVVSAHSPSWRRPALSVEALMRMTNSPNNGTNSHQYLALLILFFCNGVCPAQTISGVAQSAGDDYTISQVNPNSRVWANSAGQSVTEIATGMNYWDGQQWTPSNPSFVVSPDGTQFVAAQIQDPTRLAANLNIQGAVTVTTPDNVTLSSTPIAIGLYDAASGLSAIVATLTNTTGVQVDAQDVVYDRALVGGGFAASVVYSLPDTGSFHQDVVFTGFNPGFNPTNWGFAESSTNSLQIQIITEFYNPPQPLMLTNPIYIEQNPAIRASMASPDLIDYTLDFGDYVFGPGRAYTTAANAGPSGGVRVMKDFVTSSGRTFLVESVPFMWLASQLQALPPVAFNSASPRPATAKRTMLAATSLPPIPQATLVGRVPPRGASSASLLPRRLAAAKPRGVTVDYIVTVSSTVEPTLYASDTTYFVNGNVTCSGPTTMESAVFKFPTNGYHITLENSLILATTNYRPAIFTSADDNTAGTTLSGIYSNYTGNPTGKYYGNGALYLDTSSNLSLNNLRFCYMNCAIYFESVSDTQSLTLSHSQLVNCNMGFNLAGSTSGGGDVQGGGGLPPTGGGSTTALTLTVNNCLMAQVANPFAASIIALTGLACNCTIDSSSELFYAPSNVSGAFGFTNCILSSISSLGTLDDLDAIGGYNAFSNTWTSFGSPYTNLTASPYQSNGAGHYYLPTTSGLLTYGTSDIASSLLSQLQAKTTQAPQSPFLTNSYTANTTLDNVALLDTPGTALGFHYDKIDYIAACSVSGGVTLSLTNGVVLAYYANYGVMVEGSSAFVSQGTPIQRNYLVYYGQVQEEPTNLWPTNTAVAQALPI
jgi:hypothetical protein